MHKKEPTLESVLWNSMKQQDDDAESRLVNFFTTSIHSLLKLIVLNLSIAYGIFFLLQKRLGAA